MTAAIPAAIPVTSPLDEPIVAVVVGVIPHNPPPAPSPKVVVCPTHTCIVPVIAVGAVFTVTDAVALQPVPNV